MWYVLQFLFEVAAKNCVDLATDRHGCCVLQKCLGHPGGEQRIRLIREIATNSLIISQNQFGYSCHIPLSVLLHCYFIDVQFPHQCCGNLISKIILAASWPL